MEGVYMVKKLGAYLIVIVAGLAVPYTYSGILDSVGNAVENAVQGTADVANRVVSGTAEAANTVVSGTVDAADRVVSGTVNGTRRVVNGPDADDEDEIILYEDEINDAY
jgi:methylmalonyl-CoA mutase cobalamin-binding subunit